MTILAYAVNLFCEVLIFLIIAEAIMSWFIRPGDRAYAIFAFVRRLTEPILRPFRSIMGRFTMSIGIDFSPVLAIIVISVVNRLLIRLLLIV